MNGLTAQGLRAHFPHPDLRDGQREALKFIVESPKGVTIEMPTGEGKTDTGMTPLLALLAKGTGPLFYVTPSKVLVAQLAEQFPDKVTVMLGRGEHECIFYPRREDGTFVTAQESPCYMLQCKHRVNQETGETQVPGATPCPYFKAKYEAKKRAEAGQTIIATTTSWFLMNRMMVGGWREMEPALTVVDEAHGIAEIAREIFEYTLTDFHLRRCIANLRLFSDEQADLLQTFLSSFMGIVRGRPSMEGNPDKPSLLKAEQIGKLIERLNALNVQEIEDAIAKAVVNGDIDPLRERDTLKVLEHLIRGIPRLVRSLEFALGDADEEGEAEEIGRTEDGRRKFPLNYVIAFHYRKDDPEVAENDDRKARYFMTIKGYFVQPVIRKAIGKYNIILSATIGDPRIFRFETGIKNPFLALPGTFAAANTRAWMPKDAPDLSFKAMRGQHGRRDAVKHAIRSVVDGCKRFADAGHRSLVLVVSNDERARFLRLAEARGLTGVVSYGEGQGRTAREAAAAFKAGEGMVLVGTLAQYSHGLDLPGKMAPVIWFLRPGYAPPYDPRAQFETKRFGDGQCWALWNWRVMIQALQVRGRNIRGSEDVGVCFFVAKGFHRFLFNALPEWLKPAYMRDQTLEQGIEETLKLLDK